MKEKLSDMIFSSYEFEKKNYVDNIKDKMWDVFGQKFEEVKYDLENFRSNGLTCGIEIGLLQSDRDKILGKRIDTTIAVEESLSIIERYNNLITLINNKKFVDDNIECVVGNPQYTNYNDLRLNVSDLFHIYDLWQITRLINKEEVKFILEIGGGFGMLANKILKNFNNIKYISIDLPETLILQHYYLNTLHPNLKIVRYKDVLGKKIDELDFDILLLPAFDFEILFDLDLDLVINCRGFSEMSKEMLLIYFNLIHKTVNKSKYLYLGAERYMAYRGIVPVGVKNYPFDNNWSIIISQPSWMCTHGHDFLLKRDFNPIVEFTKILESFPNTTPPPGPITKNYDLESWLKNNNVPKSHIF